MYNNGSYNPIYLNDSTRKIENKYNLSKYKLIHSIKNHMRFFLHKKFDNVAVQK